MASLSAVSRPSPLLVLALGLCLCACGPQENACEVGLEHRTELFMGMHRENSTPVTDEEFRAFVDAVVTPRFMDGLTLFAAQGQYLMDNGTLIHEDTRVLLLLHDGSKARSADITAICEEYKQRFQQESVLRIDSSSCVAFE